MRVNKFLLPVLVIVSLLGSVGIAKLSGDWSVSGKAMLDVGELTSDDIRGWMTLQQVADGFGLRIEDLYSLVGVPADISPDTALKDLEKIVPGFEVSTVRDLLESGTLPLPENDTATPQPTILPTEVIATPTPTVYEPKGGPTPLPAGFYLPASEIKGRTTLKEIVENGQVRVEDLLDALGLPEDFDLNTAAKDLVGTGKVTSVEVLKEIVSELQSR